ncbi:MAG: glycosyltransferase family 2 protein [Clostridiales bacterium]|nr:glycosyltransferase family 2 protein [Clostridiales bacterium]
MKNKPYSLSVVITAVNETKSLKDNVDVLLKTCDKNDLKEIIIVLSKKASGECLETVKDIKNSSSTVPLVSFFQEEPGLGRAIHEAMKRATGSHVVYLTADGDTDPYLVENMVKLSKKNPRAVVLASRWVKGGGFEGYGFFNRLLNRIFNLIVQILYLTRLSDLTYAYRLAPTDLSLSVKWDSASSSVGLETNLRMLRLGYEFIELPAVWRVRQEGKSSNSFLNKLGYLRYVFSVRFSSIKSNLSTNESEQAK